MSSIVVLHCSGPLLAGVDHLKNKWVLVSFPYPHIANFVILELSDHLGDSQRDEALHQIVANGKPTSRHPLAQILLQVLDQFVLQRWVAQFHAEHIADSTAGETFHSGRLLVRLDCGNARKLFFKFECLFKLNHCQPVLQRWVLLQTLWSRKCCTERKTMAGA